MTTEKIPFYLKWTAILVGSIAFTYILYVGQSVIAPLVFALFTAILLNPVVNFLVRKKVNRIVAIWIALILTVLVLALLIFFISMQVTMFHNDYHLFREKFDKTGEDILKWCSVKFNIQLSVLNKWVKNAQEGAVKSLTGGLGDILLGLSGALIVLVLIPVYIFLILYYKSLLLEFIRKLFSTEHHKTVAEVLQSINKLIRSYLFGLLIEGVIVAVLNSIGLLILGVEYAILLGITGAILNVIPYIGGLAAIVIPMVVAFVTKSGLSAILVLVVYSVIQFIDNHYIVPYIVASKVKVNALVAIVVVLVGDMLWGVPGMFLSIPLTALAKVVFDHIDDAKAYGYLLGDDMPDPVTFSFLRKRSPPKIDG